MSELKYQEVVMDQDLKEYFFPNFWSEFKEYFYYLIKVILVVGLLYTFVRSSIGEKIAVTGISMQPNYNASLTAEDDPLSKANLDKEDKVIIDKLTPKFSEYRRGEVVVIISPELEDQPDKPKSLFFKRVIGLPGESIKFENGKVYIINSDTNNDGFELNESEYLPKEVETFKNVFDAEDNSNNIVKIPEGYYYVMGDNRSRSNDSRIFGPIPKSTIRGRELYRIEPQNHKGWPKIPTYQSKK
jgi:signal peptidase I